MQALRRFSSGSNAKLSAERSLGCHFHTSSVSKVNAVEDKGFLKNTVTATVGTVTKKFKEATGSQKAVSTNESQEPAGVMENRDANEANQPQSRYSAIADKAKDQWQGRNVVDMYPDAKKNAEATAESAKTKAAEDRDPIS